MSKLIIEARFGIIPNDLLNNEKISWKAKGLFGYIQSKPENWDFSVERVCKQAKDGKDSTSAGILELEQAGYLIRRCIRLENGTWDNEWTLYGEPHHSGKADTVTIAENPPTENPPTENPPTIKERNSKKEIVNNTLVLSEPQKNSFEEAEQLFQQLEEMIETSQKFDKEAEKFLIYWTAPTKTGKPRWRTEKTFAFKMRWATWKERSGGNMAGVSSFHSKPPRGTIG